MFTSSLALVSRSRTLGGTSFLLAFGLLAGFANDAQASGEVAFGGAHAGYAMGAGAAPSHSALRHGLDVAVLPVMIVTARNAGSHSFESKQGITMGPSLFLGLGPTPTYLGMDAGYGGSTIVGFFIGGGPVYRFPFEGMNDAYGGETRIFVDIAFVDAGIRLMGLYGEQSSEVAGTFFLGLGRF